MRSFANITNNWALIEVLFALENANVLTVLSRSPQPMLITEIADACSVSAPETEAMLQFLCVSFPDFIDTDDRNRYVMSEVYTAEHFTNIFNFARAYKPVLHAAKDVLVQETDLPQRDVTSLGISSQYYTQRFTHILIDLIRRHAAIDQIVDLGCGNGHLTHTLSQSFKLPVAGVDVAVTGMSQNEAVTFIDGSLEKPKEWLPEIKGSNPIFVSCFAWHEILIHGEEYFIDVLGQYKKLFPGRTLLMVEFDAVPFNVLREQERSVIDGAALYQMVHPLTQQGLPRSRTEWRTLLHKAEVKITGEYDTTVSSVIYEIVLT